MDKIYALTALSILVSTSTFATDQNSPAHISGQSHFTVLAAETQMSDDDQTKIIDVNGTLEVVPVGTSAPKPSNFTPPTPDNSASSQSQPQSQPIPPPSRVPGTLPTPATIPGNQTSMMPQMPPR